MEYKKITSKEFAQQFEVKEFKGQWNCFGTWNCSDMYELSDTPENARIAMWERLMKAGWAYTWRQEALIKLAVQSYFGSQDPEMVRVAKLLSN